jgi:hypothetical protein
LGNATTFGKKQGSTNGNDSRFAHLAAQFCILTCNCIVPGVDKEEQWKNSRSNAKFISKGFIESFRAKKTSLKIRANKTRFMEETFGFCQETIWKHKVCGGIFG